MKKLAIFLTLLFLAGAFLASCDEQNALVKETQNAAVDKNSASYLETQESVADTTAKHKILIIPFQNQADMSAYPNSEIYKTMLFTSFYNLFSILPSIDIPDKSALLTLKISEDMLADLAKQYQCEYIVFGNYSLKGGKTQPDAAIDLKIWNRLSGVITTNSLSTPTDADFFDALDSLQTKAVSAILNEDMKIAYLNFNNFVTGGEKLGLFINHRLVAEPVSNDFKLNLKIISGKDYNISVRRFQDGKLLGGTIANLDPGESMNFSATNRRINVIPNADFDPETFKTGPWVNPEDSLILLLENGECHIQFKKNNAANVWDYQLMAGPISLTGGTKYRISFNAKASENEDIYINVTGNGPPFTPYLTGGVPKRMPITTEMKSYMLEFRMPKADNNAKFEFDLGYSHGDIWFSNVMIEEI